MEASFCLFWLRSKQASGAETHRPRLNSEAQVGEDAPRLQTRVLPVLARLRGVPRLPAVPSGFPRHDSRRRSGHGRGKAAATERTASQSRTRAFGFPPRAGAPREPTCGPPSRGGRRQHLLPSLLSLPPGVALRRRSGPQRRGNSGAAKRPGRAAPEERAGARRQGGYKREGAGGGRKWAVQLLGVLLFSSWASRGASSGRPPVQAAVTEPLAPRTRLFPGVVSARGLRDLQAQHGAGGVGVPEPEPAGGLLGGGAALRRRD